jgi:PPK2 family polyphosphate:nucleotide phosphotransferase
MKTRKIRKELARLAARYDVRKGLKFRLEDVDPDDTSGIKSEADALKLLSRSTEMLSHMQETLYAQDRWALLLIFQGMDAAGKDGAIKHVMSGVNPQGCDVRSFKAPSHEELDHDFLWRAHKACPERGRIGIFNRSYYEEVLVVRVHGELLAAERLPEPLMSKHIWDERYEDINAHERYLTRNGVVIRKFFLHLSKEEQRKRPWYVVPADHKWYTRLVVAAAIVETLAGLDLAFPEEDRAKRKELEKVREALLKS